MSGRPEEQRMLEELVEKTKRKGEEAIAEMEKLESAIEKVDQIMNKAESVRKLDLEAKSLGDHKQDTSVDYDTTMKRLEEVEKEMKKMYEMIDELTKTEIYQTEQKKPHIRDEMKDLHSRDEI